MKCRWCRKCYFECQLKGCLSDACKDDLRAFVERNGQRWRLKLQADWAAGSDILSELRERVAPAEIPWVRPEMKKRNLTLMNSIVSFDTKGENHDTRTTSSVP